MNVPIAADAVIEVDGLVFDYSTKRALHDVGFVVGRGSVAALVGPNGAGKTTLLSCLAALQVPSAGRVVVDGVDVLESPRECHRRVGYLCDFYGLYDELTAAQCLHYAARSHGVAAGRCAERVATTAARLGIEDLLESKAGALSRGQRQRLAIAQAIVHEPAVLLLDEPASGLDPEARHALAELMLSLRDHGMTLLVSSHILAELDEYSSEMLIMRDGRIVEHHGLAAKPGGSRVFRVEVVRAAPALREVLAASELASDVHVDGLRAELSFSGDEAAQAALLRELLEAGVEVASFAERRVGMQETYLARVAGAPVAEARR